jgi:transcriptional regulator with XRE-family HTH domain
MTPDSMAKARRDLGAWLAGKREVAGLSRAQVADLIGHSEAFVARYEAGSELGLEEFGKITEVLGVAPDEALKLVSDLSGEPRGGQDGNRD